MNTRASTFVENNLPEYSRRDDVMISNDLDLVVEIIWYKTFDIIKTSIADVENYRELRKKCLTLDKKLLDESIANYIYSTGKPIPAGIKKERGNIIEELHSLEKEL